MRGTTLVLLSLCIVGCDSDPDAPDCTAGATVAGKVISGPTDLTVESDLKVRGVASHSEGLTIRRVLVDGIAATNDGFNFENWSATLPIDLLAGQQEGGIVTVAVTAEDACEQTFPLESFSVKVDPTPGVRVTQLAITATLPNSQHPYLPANGDVPAVLTITGNADAANAVVTLSSSIGSFSPSNQVTLEGDGTNAATATVLFSGKTDTPDTAIITAAAKGFSATPISIRVAGAPSLVPPSGTLAPGGHLGVTVQTEGFVESCQATPAEGLTITSGGSPLTTPGGVDTTGDGLIDIDVGAANPLTATATATIQCRDPFNQFSAGTYTAVKP